MPYKYDPKTQASEQSVAELQEIKDSLERLQERVEVVINSTPTGEDRNKATEVNIHLIGAITALVHFT